MRSATTILLIALAVALALRPSGAAATPIMGSTIEPGTFVLHDHPDAPNKPPGSGMQLYGPFGMTRTLPVLLAPVGLLDSSVPVNSHVSFDFDHAGAHVLMDYTALGSTGAIHIFGKAYGGIVNGNAFAAPGSNSLTGMYALNFTYNVGVGPDGITVIDNAKTNKNKGAVTELFGKHLVMKLGNVLHSGVSFELESGYPGTSSTTITGTGGLDYSNTFGSGSGDFLFIATPETSGAGIPPAVPLPPAVCAGTALLILAAALRRRYRVTSVLP
jgi:hypothetical protein